MTEQFPLAEQIEDATIVDDLDGPAAHDAHVLHRVGPLGDDRRSGSVELDLHGPGNAVDNVGLERVERWVLP